MTMIILETCGLWDIDYKSETWEPEFITIYVTWQLRVTLNSIRNSCDVFIGTWFGRPVDFLPEGQSIEYQLVDNIHELLFSPLTFTKKMQDHLKLLCLIEFL